MELSAWKTLSFLSFCLIISEISEASGETSTEKREETQRATLLHILISGIVGLGVFYYCTKIQQEPEPEPTQQDAHSDVAADSVKTDTDTVDGGQCPQSDVKVENEDTVDSGQPAAEEMVRPEIATTRTSQPPVGTGEDTAGGGQPAAEEMVRPEIATTRTSQPPVGTGEDTVGGGQPAAEEMVRREIATTQASQPQNQQPKEKEPVAEEPVKGETVAIDLGTSFCSVATIGEGTSEVIPNEHGRRSTPSVVAFTSEGTLVGDAAVQYAETDPENAVYDIKRLIGRDFGEAAVQKDLTVWPFRVSGRQGTPVVHVLQDGEERQLTATELTALILGKLKADAEAYIGKPVTDAVVSVPAYFNNSQRQATKDAGSLCGLNVIRIVNEPTAAGIAFSKAQTEEGVLSSGNISRVQREPRELSALYPYEVFSQPAELTLHVVKNILVFHLGGGSFDVSVMQVGGGNVDVKATAGNSSLGGRDFTAALFHHVIAELEKDAGAAGRGQDRRLVARLYQACETAKIQLSTQHTADVIVPDVADGQQFCCSISRQKFEELNMELFEEVMATVRFALELARMKKEQIDEVVLTGGATKMPRIQQDIRRELHKDRLRQVDLHEAIVSGTAVQAAVAAGKTGELDLTAVKEVSEIITVTVGIETKGGIMAALVERGAKIPTTRQQEFSTAKHNQTNCTIEVFEGERPLTKYNQSLGKFVLSGIPPGPRGKHKVQVTFHVDADGIFNISAKETSSGSSGEITINHEKVERSVHQLEQMVKDAAAHQRADEEELGRLRARNDLEGYLDDVTSVLETAEDSFMSPADRARVASRCSQLTSWLEDNQLADKEAFVQRLQDMRELCSSYIEEGTEAL